MSTSLGMIHHSIKSYNITNNDGSEHMNNMPPNYAQNDPSNMNRMIVTPQISPAVNAVQPTSPHYKYNTPFSPQIQSYHSVSSNQGAPLSYGGEQIYDHQRNQQQQHFQQQPPPPPPLYPAHGSAHNQPYQMQTYPGQYSTQQQSTYIPQYHPTPPPTGGYSQVSPLPSYQQPLQVSMISAGNQQVSPDTPQSGPHAGMTGGGESSPSSTSTQPSKGRKQRKQAPTLATGRRNLKNERVDIEEAERRHKRRERNRKSAQKCRERKLNRTQELREETDILKSEQQQLRDEIHQCLEEARRCYDLLQRQCPVMDPPYFPGLLEALSGSPGSSPPMPQANLPPTQEILAHSQSGILPYDSSYVTQTDDYNTYPSGSPSSLLDHLNGWPQFEGSSSPLPTSGESNGSLGII